MALPDSIDSRRLADLLAVALRLGVDRLPAAMREAGRGTGPELLVLQALLGTGPASSGQARTPLAESVAPSDGAPVPALVLTFADAGRMLDVSERTVRRLVEAGQLRAISVAGSRRIPHSELIAYVERALAA